MRSSAPPSAPRASTSRMLFAFARRRWRSTKPRPRTCGSAHERARRTCVQRDALGSAAGARRGCQSLATVRASSAARAASLCVQPVDAATAGGDGALDERCVGDGQARELVRRQLVQRGADGEDGAAEVDEHDRARAGARTRAPRARGRRPCRATRRPLRPRLRSERRPGDLARQIGQASGDLGAVRDEHRVRTVPLRLGHGAILQCRTAFGNGPEAIQSVDRAARILKALGEHPGRLGLRDLADRLGLAKTTVHGLSGPCKSMGSSSSTSTPTSTSSARSCFSSGTTTSI